MYETKRPVVDEAELSEESLCDVKAGLSPKAFADEQTRLANEHEASKNEGG